MNRYGRGKEKARQKAQEWQNSASAGVCAWSDIANGAEMFRRIGKRYGLTKEFRENGII